MAQPKCGFCDGTFFEVTTVAPTKSRYKLLATHCAKCGAILGMTESLNIGAVLSQISKKLGL